ncbi:unnamed protein product [Sphagnum troendelagicum]|uniref:Uncharacterized protein n=1 Tax=Sphagnum troendelagicum TaxID=128251 RepID=A0ABP0UVX4_9BRYO
MTRRLKRSEGTRDQIVQSNAGLYSGHSEKVRHSFRARGICEVLQNLFDAPINVLTVVSNLPLVIFGYRLRIQVLVRVLQAYCRKVDSAYVKTFTKDDFDASDILRHVPSIEFGIEELNFMILLSIGLGIDTMGFFFPEDFGDEAFRPIWQLSQICQLGNNLKSEAGVLDTGRHTVQSCNHLTDIGSELVS